MNADVYHTLRSLGCDEAHAVAVSHGVDVTGRGALALFTIVFVPKPGDARPTVAAFASAATTITPGQAATCSVLANEFLYQVAGEVDFLAVTQGRSALPEGVKAPANLSALIAEAVAKAAGETDPK